MNKPNGGDPIVTSFGKSAPVHMHKYPLSYRYAQTERFAECNPFFNYEGIPKDKDIILYTGSSVDTMSLNAPILQDIRKNMDYYLIDKHALLPHTYDFIKNQPTHGDDIDAFRANCLLYLGDSDFGSGLVSATVRIIESAAFFDGNGDAIYDDSTFTFSVFRNFMMALAWLNEHFSDDSLFAQFRIPLADYVGRRTELLAILDECWKLYHDILENQAVALESDGVDSPFSVDFMDSDNNVVHRALYDWHSVSDRLQMYYDFLDNPNIKLSSNDYWDAEYASGEYPKAGSLIATYFTTSASAFEALFNSSNLEHPLNIEKLLAYQLCMAEFQSNDKVDYIYSADIFRRVYESVAYEYDLTFDYNGVKQLFDGFSAVTLSYILGNSDNLFSYDLWMQLIIKKRSLRYIDYFCGVRPTPLAVGDYNVAVNNNVASVIDITEKIQFARFGLAVNRVGRKAKEYLRGIFASKERVDICCPVKIGHTDCMLYQEVTQNTAADQLELDNSRTSVLKSREKRFAFNTDCDVDSIILGITSYEITRFYEKGLDPFALKVDRFDMFNPFLQYIGDQPIQSVELNAENNVGDIWGYNSRHIEYKAGCAVDYCVGGFRNELSGWIFKQPDLAHGEFINPDFIRAHQNELDRYYVALTGTTPTRRYHFICKYNNYVSATRNMVKAPQILGF